MNHRHPALFGRKDKTSLPCLSRSPVPLVMSSRQLRLACGGANHPMRTFTRYFTSGQGRPRRDSRDSVQRLEATSIHAHADRLLTYPRSPPVNHAEHPANTFSAILDPSPSPLHNQHQMIARHSGQHTIPTVNNEAGAPSWATPASYIHARRDQCPGQLRIDVSAATA